MIRAAYLRTCSLGKQLVRQDRAAQLVEFAVSLPLLVLFVVGIFDFSAAFNLTSGVPSSITHAFKVIDSYLTANNLNDCGLASKTPSSSGVTWTYTVAPTGNPPCGITVIINRGYYFPVTSTTAPALNCQSQAPGGQTALVGTCVSIQYAYAWRFGRAASLLGRNTALPADLSAVAVSLNEN